MIEVTDYSTAGWRSSATVDERARWYCEQLERGEILYFPGTQSLISDTNRQSLLGLPAAALSEKNVSYAPSTQKLAGVRGANLGGPVRRALEEYSQSAVRFCAKFLTPYAESWRIELCSFRPLEERDRDLGRNERNDLLHVDAFPSRPGNGARILRMFTNIHPERRRVWLTSDPLPTLSREAVVESMFNAAIHKAESLTSRTGAKVIRYALGGGTRLRDRSPYDRVMLALHDKMKADDAFQSQCRKYRHEFAPAASWLVFTDTVPHAVLEGQYAVEQSFFVPTKALVVPEVAPLSIVESLAGHSMTL